jgi:hypothetical protein
MTNYTHTRVGVIEHLVYFYIYISWIFICPNSVIVEIKIPSYPYPLWNSIETSTIIISLIVSQLWSS